MPKVSKESAANQQDYGPVVDHSEEVDGYTVSFTTFKVDIDSTPMLEGLPGDSCPCPHWGYVLKGRLVFTIDGREEAYEQGDAFYVPPGHLQRADAGSEYLQFSPTEELKRVSEHMQRRMREMQGQGQ
jgi:hypothetical protein